MYLYFIPYSVTIDFTKHIGAEFINIALLKSSGIRKGVGLAGCESVKDPRNKLKYFYE